MRAAARSVLYPPVMAPPDLQRLLTIVLETRSFIARPENDFRDSRWRDSKEATQEFDSFVSELRSGILPENLAAEFAPASSTQEVSINSGWALEFVNLVERYGKAINSMAPC